MMDDPACHFHSTTGEAAPDPTSKTSSKVSLYLLSIYWIISEQSKSAIDPTETVVVSIYLLYYTFQILCTLSKLIQLTGTQCHASGCNITCYFTYHTCYSHY